MSERGTTSKSLEGSSGGTPCLWHLSHEISGLNKVPLLAPTAPSTSMLCPQEEILYLCLSSLRKYLTPQPRSVFAKKKNVSPDTHTACYPINIHLINNSPKRVLILLLVTAKFKCLFPRKAFPDYRQGMLERERPTDSQCLIHGPPSTACLPV